MFCNECGIANPDGSRFCSGCGSGLQPTDFPAAKQAQTDTSSGASALSTPAPYRTLGGLPTDLARLSGELEPVLQVGKVFGDRYEIRRLLGRGGMGEVYEAMDGVLKDSVALKVLRRDLHEHKEAIERFTREAKISLRLSHKNIVRVHDIFIVEDLRCISMELVNGISLRKFLQNRAKANKPVEVKEALRLGATICEAMQYAHGVTIHRDLKPENVLVTREGTIKVSDFGIAHLLTATQFQVTSAALGTAYYMAPEQSAARGDLDHRADIYSLGVVLYEALVGQLPIGRFQSPRELRGDVPESLDEVILAALETDPRRRPQTMKEFRDRIVAPAIAAKATPKRAVPLEPPTPPRPIPVGPATQVQPQSAEALLRQAKGLISSGRHVDALGCLDQAVQIAPGLAEAWYLRGQSLSRTKLGTTSQETLARIANRELNLDEATQIGEEVKRCFRRAAELEPQNPIYTITAQAANQSNEDSLFASQSDGAALDGRQATRKGVFGRLLGPSGSAHNYVQAGNTLTMQGKFQEAVRQYDLAIKADRNCADAWFGKGVALAKSIGGNQQETFALIARGELTMAEYQRIGGQAKECLIKAGQLNPNNPMYKLMMQGLQ